MANNLKFTYTETDLTARLNIITSNYLFNQKEIVMAFTRTYLQKRSEQVNKNGQNSISIEPALKEIDFQIQRKMYINMLKEIRKRRKI